MRTLASHLALSLLALGASLSPSSFPRAAVAGRVPAPAAPHRLYCGDPEHLRLRRFEDGSAWLRCGARTLARVSVPG